MKKLLFLLILLVSSLFLGCSKEDDGPVEETDKGTDEIKVDPYKQTSSVRLPGNSATDIWGFSQSGKEYAVIGNMSPGDENFYILEVPDPEPGGAPELISTTSYPAFDMKTWKNYLYVVNGTHDQSGANGGMIYDISNPEVPVVVGNFPSSHNIFIDDRGYLYLSGRRVEGDQEFKEKGITIYNLNNDPAQPEEVWTSSFNGSHDIAVIGERMFDFHGSLGTFIYDVSDPANPIVLTDLFTEAGYDHSGWPTEDGNYLFITNELAASSQFDFTNVVGGADISIWNISDISNPLKVGEIHDESSRVHNLYIIDNLAYVSYYSAGLKIFDVADPENPVLVYEYDTNKIDDASLSDGFIGAFGVYPFSPSGNIYVSDTNNDLFIFKPVGNNE